MYFLTYFSFHITGGLVGLQLHGLETEAVFPSSRPHMPIPTPAPSCKNESNKRQPNPHSNILYIYALIYHYPAPKDARAAGYYWQTVPPQWGGGRLFGALAAFFFLRKRAFLRNEKSHNRAKGPFSAFGPNVKTFVSRQKMTFGPNWHFWSFWAKYHF